MTSYSISDSRDVNYLVDDATVEGIVHVLGGPALDEYIADHAEDVMRVQAVPSAFDADFVHGFARRLIDLAVVRDGDGNSLTFSGTAEHFHTPRYGWEVDAFETESREGLVDLVGTWAQYHYDDLRAVARDFGGRHLPFPKSIASDAYQLGGIAASSIDGRGQGFWTVEFIDSEAARRLSRAVTEDLGHVCAEYDRDGGDVRVTLVPYDEDDDAPQQ